MVVVSLGNDLTSKANPCTIHLIEAATGDQLAACSHPTDAAVSTSEGGKYHKNPPLLTAFLRVPFQEFPSAPSAFISVTLRPWVYPTDAHNQSFQHVEAEPLKTSTWWAGAAYHATMVVTTQLRKVFEVDQHIAGLKSRLSGADHFLAEQQRQLAELDGKITAIETEAKKNKVQQASLEKEAAALEARMVTLRDAMGSARTNKEYAVFLTELNTIKAQKDEKEKAQLELMEKVEAGMKQIAEINVRQTERQAMVVKAGEERAKRQSEIASKLSEHEAKRATLAADVSTEHLKLLAELTLRLGENAMAKLDEIDRRNHEWACSSCMRAVPVQSISTILKGQLTRCSNCTCILYADEAQDVGAKKLKKNEPAEQL